MKKRFYSASIIFFALILLGSCQSELDPRREFYQLKIYSLDSARQEAVMDKYLSEAYLPALKKQGLKNIGVFKNRKTETDSSTSIYVLVPYGSLDLVQTVEDNVLLDPSYLKSAEPFLTSSNMEAPYARQRSVLLRAFKDMPMMRPTMVVGSRTDRVYELRSYESATEEKYRNKVDMFNAGGEVKLFERLGFNAVFYGEVLSGQVMPNLMYMTTFTDLKSRDEHWKVFVDSPEWKALKAMPKYEKNVSHIDIYFLYPADYSDY